MTCQSINSNTNELTNYCGLSENKNNQICKDRDWNTFDNDSYKNSLRKCDETKDESNCFNIVHNTDGTKSCPTSVPQPSPSPPPPPSPSPSPVSCKKGETWDEDGTCVGCPDSSQRSL